MSTNSERILRARGFSPALARSLHNVAQTRALESANASPKQESGLMQMAGEAVAKLALAIAPYAHTYWIACGPGNNGGDGFQAARYLRQWGKNPLVSYLPADTPSADALLARNAALQAGVMVSDRAPDAFDVCVDALFGIGTLRPFGQVHAQWISTMNTSQQPVLAVDVPSGLDADTGAANALHVRASHTLSLLTLKPGLFTAQGRDACGDIWFNDLGITSPGAASAQLIATPPGGQRLHNSHKGSYGDVAIVGGAHGMDGAAVLAGSAALHAGAGRVFVCLLSAQKASYDVCQPELMFRPFGQLDWAHMTVVAGCGGGKAIAQHLEVLLRDAKSLVLDANALNQIAISPALQALLAKRDPSHTVLTPHPLEAARLMGCTVGEVQSGRLNAAQAMAQKFNSTVVLKGSGSVVACPGETPRINTTGNGLLASAGTGDVLAGLIGARLAQGQGSQAQSQGAFSVACAAVHQHGRVADAWPHARLSASELSRMLGH